MQAEVIKGFKDQHTSVRYKIGMTYEGTKERLAELAGLGYVKPSPEPIQETEPVRRKQRTLKG